MKDDPRIDDRIRSERWDGVRAPFQRMHRHLLSLGECVQAELTTIYVKYTYSADPTAAVFAVIWLRNSKQIDVGLALPEGQVPGALASSVRGLRYPPLNAFFCVSAGDPVPNGFEEWAQAAYRFRVRADPENHIG
jgi:hypothetical protein